MAWSSYYAIANTTYDEYQGTRLAGQGGSYKYIHGLDGAIGDLALLGGPLRARVELHRPGHALCVALAGAIQQSIGG